MNKEFNTLTLYVPKELVMALRMYLLPKNKSMSKWIREKIRETISEKDA